MTESVSRPTLYGFKPVIPYQRDVIDLVDTYDYSQGILEILLSGAYGSAKSTLLAHLGVTHCMNFPKAGCLIGRKSLPDLEKTLWKEILDHIEEDLVEGEDYEVNLAKHIITFANDSQIFAMTWGDRKFKKFRSVKLSMALIEEMTENDDTDWQAIREIKNRLGRIPWIYENVLAGATNPDSPHHPVYKYFIEPNTGGKKHPNRFPFFSKARDNIFLPKSYVDQLCRDLSPREVQRFVEGEWVEIDREVIYYAYNRDRQFVNRTYEYDPRYPVILTWDFNIGLGKPLSMAVLQYINDEFHVADQVVIEGGRTADSLDELNDKGILDKKFRFYLCGDQSGRNRDTRSNVSDWDIIIKYMQNKGLNFEFHVPPSNPPVRHRHNVVNAYCMNGVGKTRLFVYEKAKTVDEALRLTSLKKGATYIEDDSKSYQHIGTALGYAIVFETTQAARKPQGTILF